MDVKLKIAVLTVAVAIAACGKNPSNPASAAGEKVSNLISSNGIEKDENENVIFHREVLQKFDRYAVIDRTKNLMISGDEARDKVTSQYRNLFWSGATLDYDLLAYDFLKEARLEKDSFKRSDIAKTNHGKLDAAYKEAKNNKYFSLYFKGDHEASIGKYNSEKKGFPLGFSIEQKEAFGWFKPNEANMNPTPTWGVIVVGANSGPQDSTYYIPKNEDEARKIESKLSSLRKNGDYVYMPTYYLGHVASAVMKPAYGEYHNAIMVVDGVSVQDPETKQVLFTFDLNEKDKKVISSTSEIKLAVFPENSK